MDLSPNRYERMMTKRLLLIVFWTVFTPPRGIVALSTERPKLYRYFAYGSNMVPSTLTSLRRVHYLNASAAVLPNYQLKFNVPGGLVEGAAASVQTTSDDEVHGVLYELTATDFARVGITEGVPIVYRWEKCRVYPYEGNGMCAGTAAKEGTAVIAYTLVCNFPRDMPPSRSYRDLLIQGAEEWKLDKSYCDRLRASPVANNLLVPGGVSGLMLKFAELGRPSPPK